MLFHQPWLTFVPFNLFRMFGHFGVDIFFFLSGFGIVYSLRKNSSTLQFYKRRLHRLLPLCVVCGSIKFALSKTGFVDASVSKLTIVGLDLWFLCVLWFCYLFSPYILKLADRFKVKLLLLSIVLSCIVISPQLADYLHIYVKWGFARLPVFVLGVLIASKNMSVSKDNCHWGIIFMLLACLFRLGFLVKIIPASYDLYNYPILLMGVCSLCWWAIEILKFIIKLDFLKKGLTYVGKHSLEFYLWHEYIYQAVKIDQPIIAFIVAMLVSVFAVVMTDELFKRIHFIGVVK